MTAHLAGHEVVRLCSGDPSLYSALAEQTFRLDVPSSSENLALIREFISTVGIQAGLEEDGVARLEMAVDEACANVIEHAYGQDRTKELTVRSKAGSASLGTR